MNKTTLVDAAMLGLSLDRASDQPLFEQLAQSLRHLILSRKITSGAKIPSSRQLASELSVSRVTVVSAIDQLIAEGYLRGQHGAGVFVVDGLPEDALQIKFDAAISSDKALKSAPPMQIAQRPFQLSNPDMRLFPHKQWAKLFQRIWTNPADELLALPDSLGFWPLRQQIADHLLVWRGIKCSPAQVIITSGAGEALQLIADGFFVDNDKQKNHASIALEDPGYGLFDHILTRNNIDTHSINVDEKGFSVDDLLALDQQPRGVIITPSRQYPLGMTMPLARRLQLLNWAGQSDRFIIEDDYDSEYRYTGAPLPALMSLSGQARVIYMGSFSKVFSKSLRLGYLVAPLDMTKKLSQVLRANSAGAAFSFQPVLAQFMQSGAFASHIRKMRRTYGQRQKVFIQAAQQHLDGLIEFTPAQGGMQLIGFPSRALAKVCNDHEICALANDAGVSLISLSQSYASKSKLQGFIAGYAGFKSEEIIAAIQALNTQLRPLITDK